MNAVIYARYSSHNQTKASIEGQLKACYEYAKQNNIIVVGEYVDLARSGTSDNREQFDKMIEDSKRKKFQTVIIYSLDRFSRNMFDYINYKTQLKKNEVEIFSVIGNTENDASGILLESIFESINKYYSLELRPMKKNKVQKKAKRRKVKQLVNEG